MDKETEQALIRMARLVWSAIAIDYIAAYGDGNIISRDSVIEAVADRMCDAHMYAPTKDVKVKKLEKIYIKLDYDERQRLLEKAFISKEYTN